MGDRLLLQCRNKAGEFGPVVYCHSSGSAAATIVAAVKKRMWVRLNDIEYATARVAQLAMDGDTHSTGFGIMTADRILTAADSHGDAGVVLIDVADFSVVCLGGYLKATDGVITAD